MCTFSISNVQENHREESNNHLQTSHRKQVLIYFEYEHLRSLKINKYMKFKLKKKKIKSFLIKKFLQKANANKINLQHFFLIIFMN